MLLAQLVYRSKAANSLEGMERMVALRHIHARAMEINHRNDVTGFLAFTMRHFIQVLEGRRSDVTATFDRIARDRRHKDIELLGITHGRTRLFDAWSMGAIFDEQVVRAAMRKIGSEGELNVATLTGAQVVDVLRVMSLQHRSVEPSNAAGRP